MNENARRTYRSLGITFLVIAAVFAAVVVGERLFNFQFFSGNPLPVALFLGFIGAALLYTVREQELREMSEDVKSEDIESKD